VIRSLDGITPRVHPSAFVSEFAYVIGDVEIGEGSSVWPGTVIRADAGKIAIGNRTCIQDNSVVHGDADVVIGNDVVIGHRVICHAGVVGDGSLIGNGAVVNDGADIGEGSLIASGAMVIERMKIPPRSMVVGVPARVRGEVQERHTRLIEATAAGYAQKAERYKRQGSLEADHDQWPVS
jgi:carbonic anhydrase/acetyltransferase-like protein (isoleucine patch superfamily)